MVLVMSALALALVLLPMRVLQSAGVASWTTTTAQPRRVTCVGVRRELTPLVAATGTRPEQQAVTHPPRHGWRQHRGVCGTWICVCAASLARWASCTRCTRPVVPWP